MSFSNFLAKYNLQPIWVSNHNIMIGTLAKKNVFGTTTDIGPATLYSVLRKHNIISQEEYEHYKTKVNELALLPANILDVKTNIDVNFASELNIPSLGNLGAAFSDDADISYRFTNIKSKLMDTDLYAAIGNELEEFKANKWEDYKQDIRKYHYIEELYYGNIEISIQTSLSAKLEAEIKKANVDFDVKGGLGKTKLIEIQNTELPFAMRLEKVKEL